MLVSVGLNQSWNIHSYLYYVLNFHKHDNGIFQIKMTVFWIPEKLCIFAPPFFSLRKAKSFLPDGNWTLRVILEILDILVKRHLKEKQYKKISWYLEQKHNDWLTAKFFNFYLFRLLQKSLRYKFWEVWTNKLLHWNHRLLGYLENTGTCVEL